MSLKLLQVDENGNHIEGNEGLCPSECPVSNCPLGFWPHLKTCIQESSSVPEDATPSVQEAEDRCITQGARLYQPRSTRSLVALAEKNHQFFKQSDSNVKGILDWATTMNTAIGVNAEIVDGAFKSLSYKDESAVPFGLTQDPKGFIWGSSYPTGTETCVNFIEKERIGELIFNSTYVHILLPIKLKYE